MTSGGAANGVRADDVLPTRVRAGYGLGSVATGSFGAVPGLLLLPLLTDNLGVAAWLAGLLVFLPKAWDVIFNPIVGGLSDRRGASSRRAFLLRGGLTLAVMFALLFFGPSSTTAGAIWVVALYSACASAYAFFQVPYMALPAELTSSYDERTRLMTWRVAVLALAILVSGGLAPVVRDAVGYWGVGLFVGALIAVGTLASWRGTADVTPRVTTSSVGSLREQLRVVSANRAFRNLVCTWIIQALATGAMLAGVDYVARWVLEDDGAATILFVCFVGPALLVTPLWQRFAERRDKRQGYVVASLVFAVGALTTWWASNVGMAATALTLAVVGVGYAGIQLFPMAMLPDVAADDATASGENRIGTFTGVWTAGETLGLALGPFLYAAVLALGGYAPSTGGGATQTGQAITAVALGFTVMPAVLVVVSLLFLRRYR